MKFVSTFLALSLLTATAMAAPTMRAAKSSGPLIEFSIETSRTLTSDLARAAAIAEGSDDDAAVLAKRINASIAAAIASAKAYPTVKVHTGTSNTQAVYSKTGRSVEGWRMRSELLLESRDAAALSELLGKLQASLTVSKISQQISPQARRKFEEELSIEAIANFQERAQKIAGAMKKPYRIKQMQLHAAQPAMPLARMSSASAASSGDAPPIVAGELQISISINGQIELGE